MNYRTLLVFLLLAAAGFAAAPDFAEWREKAEAGDANAQHNLGTLYWFGEGVPKDLVQAHVWINISAAKGTELAQKKMPNLEKEMTDSQKEKAMDMARELFAKLPKGN